MSEHFNQPLQILRRREVEALTGLSRSTIYQRIKDRSFPLPISIGSKSVGWIKCEIIEWIEERVKLSRANPRQDIGGSATERGNV